MPFNKFFFTNFSKLNKLAITCNNEVCTLCIGFSILKINWITIFNFSARIPSKLITTTHQFLTLYFTLGLQ